MSWATLKAASPTSMDVRRPSITPGRATLQTTVSPDPLILVLAEGQSPAAQRHHQGHLFEQFTARLLEQFGYEEPLTKRLNVTSDGIELDAALKHRLTGQTALVECKCHSTPVKVGAAKSFFGAISKERLRDPHVHGYLVVTPRLSPEADEFIREIQQSDSGITVLTSRQIIEILRQHELLPAHSSRSLITDHALIITEHGLFAAAKENDPFTRTATRVIVKSSAGPVPLPVLELIANFHYSEDLPVHDEDQPQEVMPPKLEETPIALVRGSHSDFEYQFPASPEFFVGRKTSLRDLTDALSDAPSVVVLNAQSGWGKSSLALMMARMVSEQDGHSVIIDSRTATSRRAFVSACLRKAAVEAQERGLITLPEDASWASLPTALATIDAATWLSASPLLIFFDQFENVFRDEDLTREFRDLALLAVTARHPLIIGFAWKTDYIGWTEDHPYQLRDEIRSVAKVITLDRFGAREVDTLMRRLGRELDEKLSQQLRRSLREYSQGLPWLFKKLAAHLIREAKRRDPRAAARRISEYSKPIRSRSRRA